MQANDLDAAIDAFTMYAWCVYDYGIVVAFFGHWLRLKGCVFAGGNVMVYVRVCVQWVSCTFTKNMLCA